MNGYRVVLNDALQLPVPHEDVPVCDLPAGLDRIEAPQRYITLVSKRGVKAIAKYLQNVDLNAVAPPKPQLGEARIVYRAPTEDRLEMACLTAPVANQAQMREFVQALFTAWGLRNPEPKFFYHLTLANNAGGNPRGSIAYVNPSDFQGPAPLAVRAFQRRADLSAASSSTPPRP